MYVSHTDTALLRAPCHFLRYHGQARGERRLVALEGLYVATPRPSRVTKHGCLLSQSARGHRTRLQLRGVQPGSNVRCTRDGSMSGAETRPMETQPTALGTPGASQAQKSIEQAIHVADGKRPGSPFMWSSFIAGGAAGCASRTIVSPLERLKSTYQKLTQLLCMLLY